MMAAPACARCYVLTRGLAHFGTTALSSHHFRWSSLAPLNGTRSLHSSSNRPAIFGKKKKKEGVDKQEASIVVKSNIFLNLKSKSSKSFVNIIDSFNENNPNRRGHVEFLYACLRNMEDFGVEKDLGVYKKMLDVFPKEKMVTKNEIQVEFMHFPWHQQCAIDILSKMEENGVIPDKEVQLTLMQVFGYRSFPMRKFARMMYWMPKFKNASPFPLPSPIPNDTFELAVMAIKRITGVDLQTKVDIYYSNALEDSIDHTWLVSAQSPKQRELIVKQPKDKPLHVDGAFRVWLRNTSIAYFNLRAEPSGPFHKPLQARDKDDVTNISAYLFTEEGIVERPSVHEQDDGTILATCATGTSSRDSLLSWIRFLQQTNPDLNAVPVIFSLRSPSTAVVPVNARGFEAKEKTVEDPKEE